MTAMHRPSTTGSDLRRVARLVVTLAAATACVGVLAEEPIRAVFKAREVDFMYRSSDVYLPCHELQGRVATILRAVGARDDIDVRVTGCEDFLVPQSGSFPHSDDPFDRRSGDPFDRANDPFDRSNDRFMNRRPEREQTAHVRVRLMTPVEVTPQVLDEIDKDKSRRELISRVTGNPTAAMNDPVVFPAQRQTVTLSRSTIRLEAEDCELLEDMSRSVFRQLDVRVVRGTTNCGRSRIAPQITVEALLPVVSNVQIPGAQQLPAQPAGQGVADPSAPATAPAESSETTAEQEQSPRN